eukprot:225994-Pelagomonas_calceolata.AAC.3
MPTSLHCVQHKNHVLFSGTKILQHTPGKGARIRCVCAGSSKWERSGRSIHASLEQCLKVGSHISACRTRSTSPYLFMVDLFVLLCPARWVHGVCLNLKMSLDTSSWFPQQHAKKLNGVCPNVLRALCKHAML